MTREEYITRAMLLGDRWRYNEKGRYFYTLSTPIDKREYLDADTMEPITQQLAWVRGEQEYGYKND